MWKSVDIICPECGTRDQTVWVDSGAPLEDEYDCQTDGCGLLSTRKISFTIAKQDIAEKTHGGTFLGDKYVTKSTAAYNRTKEQLDLKKKVSEERKRGNQEAAIDASVELASKQAEAVKRIGKD